MRYIWRSTQRSLKVAALAAVLAASGCIPTVSLHSYRDVEVAITHANSGAPVPHEPFRIVYSYVPADSPLVYHVELRTPDDVRAETDAEGKAVVKLADYAWDIDLYINETEHDRPYVFFLTKDVIRKGGIAESYHEVPMKVE